MPSHPIDEEEDVAAFLLHHRLEGVDELRREEAGTLGELEQTESKKAVDALAIAGDHEGPFGIARLEIGRLGREPDAVSLDHIGEDLLVAPFLEAVEVDRLAQERILDLLAIAQDAQLRLAFG